jgi:hypothetical protein
MGKAVYCFDTCGIHRKLTRIRNSNVSFISHKIITVFTESSIDEITYPSIP